MEQTSSFRWAWLTLAWISLGIGLVGIFVPVMPTSPFVIVAAYAAARSSRRMYFRLMRDKRFGPMIRAWYRHGAIHRPAKILATVALAISGTGLWWFSPWPVVAWVVIGIMAVVVLWLWTRPEPPDGTMARRVGSRRD